MEETHDTMQMDATQAEASPIDEAEAIAAEAPVAEAIEAVDTPPPAAVAAEPAAPPPPRNSESSAPAKSPIRAALDTYEAELNERMSEFEQILMHYAPNKKVRQPYKSAWRVQANELFTLAARIRHRKAG